MENTKEKYIETVGRRKTAVARVRVIPSSKNLITINEKELETYMPTKEMQNIVKQPLSDMTQKFTITVKVVGGGLNSQAEAIRHGIARALVKDDESRRRELKKAGYLKRDPRAKERRKFGLKKARKAPKWSKR